MRTVPALRAGIACVSAELDRPGEIGQFVVRLPQGVLLFSREAEDLLAGIAGSRWRLGGRG